MTHSYTVHSRFAICTMLVLLLGVTTVFIGVPLLWVLGRLSLNGQDRPESVWDIAFVLLFPLGGVMAAVWAWGSLQAIRAVIVSPDGTIEVKRLFSSDQVPISTVTRVHLGQDEDGDWRRMEIHHDSAMLRIDDFRHMPDLLTQLRMHVSTDVFTGEWDAGPRS